jgi:hypothetical protein
MEAATKRKINTSKEYDALFPAAANSNKTIVEQATLDDTIAFIHKVVGKTLDQTSRIAVVLKGDTVYDTCRNIWYFVYRNVAYKKDEDGLEQVRSPRRTWLDRKTGVDCDCYSTFISSILTNLNIPHKLRITKYRRDHFQHVYPVVPYNGRYIIIDCVTDRFDYEVPYSAKKDINMDLQYLDGLHGTGLGERGNDLVFDGPDDEMGALGKFGFLKKIVKAVNKINPATVLLRNGFLAAMKLNLFKVASRIKYAYLSPEEAVKRGIIKEKYDKLVKVKQKMESIFSTAGGNPKNLKKAILKGKGNKNKEVAVSGLGFISSDNPVLYMDQNTPLAQLLGPDIYYEENVRGMEGFEGLGALGEMGELGAAPFVAAASAAVAALAKLLKGIGNIFGSKQQGSEDFAETETAAADTEIAQTPAATQTSASLPTTVNAAASMATDTGNANTTTITTPVTDTSSNAARIADTSAADSVDTATDTDTIPANVTPVITDASILPVTTATAASTTANTGAANQQGFWQKNKKWLLPTVIGVGGIAVIAIGMKLLKPSANKPPLNGPPATKKPTAARGKAKKEPVTMM